MNSITSPTPDRALADLAELLPDIYRSVEHGVFKAKAHFEAENLQWEESAFSHLVRLHAKDYLQQKNRESFDIERVNLCGLWIKAAPYHIKIWKISDDGLQKASASCPPEFEQFSLVVDGERICPVFLAVFWNVDSNKNLASVSLAYPKYDDATERECWWLVPISPFAESANELPTEVSGDIPNLEPIQLPKAESSGNDV